MRKVVVSNYDPHWVHLFEEEAKRICDIFKDELVDIHHIGSTSVPGLKAKPIIDMMPVVKDVEKIDSYNNEMIQLGYEPLGENGLPGRRYYRKGEDDRTHHVHLFQWNNHSEIDRHLAVRDYLRKHPEAAKQYGELKAKLAALFPHDIKGYMDGKDLFVKNLEQHAQEWYAKQVDKG
ncbi:GrpB family protein [Bacillus timonensis]|nr:GrpB family protein [Bacillus timonensis]